MMKSSPPPFLLPKDSVPPPTAGLIFLGSCVAGRPLAYAWGRRIMARTPVLQLRWTDMWSTRAGVRRVCYVVSLV